MTSETDTTLAALRTALAESRESRDSKTLVEGLAVSAGLTLVFAIAALGMPLLGVAAGRQIRPA